MNNILYENKLTLFYFLL